MKQKILTILTAIGGIFSVSSAQAASSTVMLDPPDMADIIDKVYNVANPLFDSLSGWVWFFLAFAFVFFVVRLVMGLFNR